jgi:hypothetical protein
MSSRAWAHVLHWCCRHDAPPLVLAIVEERMLQAYMRERGVLR